MPHRASSDEEKHRIKKRNPQSDTEATTAADPDTHSPRRRSRIESPRLFKGKHDSNPDHEIPVEKEKEKDKMKMKTLKKAKSGTPHTSLLFPCVNVPKL